MTNHEHEIWQLLDKLQMDHRDMGMKITELRSQVAALKLPAPNEHRCRCGLTFKSAYKLAEHQHVSHDAPVPQHWLDIEARTAEPATEEAA